MDLFVLKKIKEGDIKAFESIFRLYYTPLCLYATSITGEQEVAEEIVQDLFYVFWKERESLPILRSIKNYLYGATRNRSLQYLEHREVRYRYRNTVLAGENPESESYTPQDQLEYKELQSLVNRALGKLPERRLRIFPDAPFRRNEIRGDSLQPLIVHKDSRSGNDQGTTNTKKRNRELYLTVMNQIEKK